MASLIVDTDIGEFVDRAVDGRCCGRGFTILLVLPTCKNYETTIRLIPTRSTAITDPTVSTSFDQLKKQGIQYHLFLLHNWY